MCRLSLFNSKDLKKEVEDSLKFKMEILANKLKLVSREEFEVQKKMIQNYPNRWEFSRMLVVYLSQMGRYQEAIDYYRRNASRTNRSVNWMFF